MPHVLVIDDQAEICEIIAAMLGDWPDTEVVCTQDAKAGSALLRERHFDLALIDGTLQQMSGIQLAEVAANQNTPVLILSGHPDINEKAAAFGFPILPKPFSIAALLLKSGDAIAGADDNIALVKASAARLLASLDVITLKPAAMSMKMTDELTM